jgi:DNA-binding transcriptional MerR regulator
MYSGADLARLDLVLALREAGVSLADIRKILANQPRLPTFWLCGFERSKRKSGQSAGSPRP